MSCCECQLDNLNDLRQYVYETLCDRESLIRGAFHMSEQILVRQGRPCGMHFCLHGPRAVMITAIWETKQNSILFYDSTGLRFQKTKLVAAPMLETVAA
ncbi:MAG: hypothetical protein JNL96_09800 [Planctomycetaceae bacterium]|nr:hypothetical protein [Planctomycetaceae bacterium]